MTTDPPRYVPPPPTSRAVRLLWWGAGLLLLAAVIALVLVLALRDGDAPAQTPQEAAERFVDALDAGDCERLAPLVSDQLAERFDCDSSSTATAALAGLAAFNVTFGAIEVLEESEDEAQVSVQVTVISTEAEAALGLVREDGAWLVDSLDLGGAGLPLPGLF